MRSKSILGAMAALLLAGCGGGGGTAVRGEVSGVVFDASGNPVRGATVFVDQGGHRSTETDSAGSYILRGVSAEDLLVRAETPDGRFVGQNLARVFENERDQSVNITLYDSTNLARIVGQVTNRFGNVQKGLRVFARPTNGSILSSSSALTDADGFFTIDRLVRGIEYRLIANAPNQGEDTALITPTIRETQQNLTLKAPSNPNLTAPQHLDAVAYTTPGQDTFRSMNAAKLAKAYEAIKQQIDPQRAARIAKRKATSRDTSLGRPIQVDLFWDPYTIADTYGFGIYRSHASDQEIQTFLHDPLAEYFSDSDVVLLPGQTYSYVVTAISSSFDENSGTGQSPDSNQVSVVPLDSLLLQLPTTNTVHWVGVAGVDNYTVFVYDEYPDVGISPIHTSAAIPSGTVSYTVPGTLTTGRTYYYVVVGKRSDGSAQTFSIVDTFRP